MTWIAYFLVISNYSRGDCLIYLVEQKFHRSKRVQQQRKRFKSNDQNRNALMLLYDVQPSIEYKLIAQTGPSHRPTFTMAVELHGKIFKGTGQTKKEAKQTGRSFPKDQSHHLIAFLSCGKGSAIDFAIRTTNLSTISFSPFHPRR